LENGKLNLQLGIPLGPIDLVDIDTRYDDGLFHAVRIVKNNRRVVLYIDDEEVADGRLPKKSGVVFAPDNRGLFIGGTTDAIVNKFKETPLPVTRGFSGCIQNLYFHDK